MEISIIISMISVIVLAGTLIFIARQTSAIKKSTKYLEYQTRPTAYFLLFRSYIYVKNTSNFLIKFYFRMSSNDNILNDSRWDDNKHGPLFIYPGAGFMQYPEAFNCAKLITGKIKIEYRVVPSHINDAKLHKNIQVVEWKYNKKTKKWRGPNGLPEEGVISLLRPPT